MQAGEVRRVPVRSEIFIGRSQQLDLREGGGTLRLHLGRSGGQIVAPALVLDAVPRFALLKHAPRILSRRTGWSLFRKARAALDLMRAEGSRALIARIDALGHGIGEGRTLLGDPASDYAVWSRLYGPSATALPADKNARMAFLVIAPGDGDGAATGALTGSLVAQGVPEGSVHLLGTSSMEETALPLEEEWICVTGCDGVFDPAFAATVGPALSSTPAGLVYFDSDALDQTGTVVPNFKPAWDEALAFQQHYVGPVIVRCEHLDPGALVGRRDSRNAILALVLSIARRGAPIELVEDVLFHVATDSRGFDPEVVEERAEVVRQHLEALELSADVAPRPALRTLEVTYRSERWPKVSAIMPTRDNLSTLPTALASLLERTDYPDIEVVVVDNGSIRPEVIAFPSEAEAGDARVRVLRHDRPFNFSELINLGAAHSSGQLLLLVNDDVEAVESDWLSTMASHFARAETGAVGAKLLYPDGTIQHAGVALGVGGGVAGHIYLGLPADTHLNHDRAQLTRRVSAVTGACLLTRRDLFDEIGGLDAEHLKVAYNDVDYCLEAGRRGRHVIYEPRAVLTHHESRSRGRDNNPTKRQRLIAEATFFQENWGAVVFHDPFYSGNYGLTSAHFPYAHPPRRRRSPPA